jgi:hypothetical protein
MSAEDATRLRKNAQKAMIEIFGFPQEYNFASLAYVDPEALRASSPSTLAELSWSSPPTLLGAWSRAVNL